MTSDTRGADRGHRVDHDAIRWDRVRQAEMVRHQLDRLVASGGRLVTSSYVPVRDRSRHAEQVLDRLGFPVDGVTAPASPDQPPSAWIQLP